MADGPGDTWPPPHWDFGMPDMLPPAPPMGGDPVTMPSQVDGRGGGMTVGQIEMTNDAPVPAQPDLGTQYADALAGKGAPDSFVGQIEMEPNQAPIPGLPDQYRRAAPEDMPPLPPVGEGQAVTKPTQVDQGLRPAWQADAQADTARNPDKMSQDEQIEFAQKHPDEWARYNISKGVKAQTEANLAQADLARKQLEDHNENIKIYRQAKANADAKMADLAKEVDNMSADGGYWKTRSGFGKFADVLSAVIGGFIQGRQGGPNIGMQMIDHNIDQAISAERAKIGQKSSLVNQLYQRLGDDYSVNEAMRQAGYKVAIDKLQADLASRDPQGNQFRTITNQILQLKSQQALSAQAMQEHYQDRNIAAMKAQSELSKNAAEEMKSRVDMAEKLKKLQGGGGVAATIPRAQVIASIGKDPGKDLSQKEYEDLLKNERQVAEIGNLRARTDIHQAEASGLTINSPEMGGPLTQENGHVYKAGDKEEAKAARSLISGAREVTDALDDVIAMTKEVGGESSVGNSPEYQKRKRRAKEAVLAFKSMLGSGAGTSDQDFERIEGALGVEDVNSYRDQLPRLTSARDFVQELLNTQMTHKYNYTGRDIVLPNRHSKGADVAPTEIDSDAERATTRSTGEKIGDNLNALGFDVESSSSDRLSALRRNFNRAYYSGNKTALEALRAAAGSKMPDVAELAQNMVRRIEAHNAPNPPSGPPFSDQAPAGAPVLTQDPPWLRK